MATVTKRGKGYRIRVFLGYDASGKQIERTKTWIPDSTKKLSEKAAYQEALRQAILFEEQLKYAANCDGRIKFTDFAEIWFSNYAEPNLRPKTVARYREMYQRIGAHLGHIPLDKIRPTHLLAFYRILEQGGEDHSYRSCVDLKKIVKGRKLTNVKFSQISGISLNTLRAAYLEKNISLTSAEKISSALGLPLSTIFKPSEERKKLSATTIHHHHALIANMLHDAVNWQYIPNNPCDRIEGPKAAVPTITFLDDKTARHFLEELQKTDNPGFYRRPIIMLLLTGLRRSELLGLEWNDIDWNAKTIRVIRTSQVNPNDNSVYTDNTKNRTSNRVICISDQVLELLREQYLWQKMQEKSPKYIKQVHNRIFTMPNGNVMHPNRLTTWFRNFIKKTDLPQDLHLHSLRHSFASIAISGGAPIPAVSRLLGHSSTRTTTDIYVHAIQSTQVATAAQVGSIFSDLL